MFYFGGNFASYARDDLLEYRQHYPNKRGDDPQASDNVKFYHNQLHAEPEHVTVEEILSKWPKNYRFLESCHSYIQWLFPIQEKGLNYQAQVLMRHEIPLLRDSPEAMGRILRSFAMMCDFYGMRFTVDLQRRQCNFQRNIIPAEEGGGSGKKQMWIKCYRNLNTSSHNYLRITRILKFLGEMGLEFIKVAWLSFFAQEIIVTGALKNCLRSFADYWVGTIYDDEERAKFTAWYKALPPSPGSAPTDTVGYYYEAFSSDDDDDDDGSKKKKEELTRGRFVVHASTGAASGTSRTLQDDDGDDDDAVRNDGAPQAREDDADRFRRRSGDN